MARGGGGGISASSRAERDELYSRGGGGSGLTCRGGVDVIQAMNRERAVLGKVEGIVEIFALKVVQDGA